MYEELIQKAKALDKKATPGPWMWDMSTEDHTCRLVTDHSGRYHVMLFSRWGLQDACPEFQQFKRYSGPVTERGGLGMVRADKMAKSYPGKEHHKGFDDYIDHPDAVFIAESRALVTELIDALSTLQTENTELRSALSRVKAERDAAKKEIERLKKCRYECKIDCLLEEYNKVCEKLACVEAERDATINDLKYYLYINEENGVVYIPKFAIEKMIGRSAQGEG